VGFRVQEELEEMPLHNHLFIFSLRNEKRGCIKPRTENQQFDYNIIMNA